MVIIPKERIERADYIQSLCDEEDEGDDRDDEVHLLRRTIDSPEPLGGHNDIRMQIIEARRTLAPQKKRHKM